MTDDAHGYQNSRTTRTRWSVFEPMGHESGHGDVPDSGGGDSDFHESMMSDAPLDPLLAAVAGELRRPVKLGAELDARVMALVAGEPRPQRDAAMGARVSGAVQAVPAHAPVPIVVRAWRWLRRPRLVLVTPLGGLAAAAGLAALLILTVRTGSSTVGEIAGSATSAPMALASSTVVAAAVDSVQVIQFVLVAPGARTVALVGDFNDWQAGVTPMGAAASGQVWSVQIPLSAGRHRYAFVVDNDSWVPDPSAPRAAGDDFGTPSSVVTVAERRS